jgi:hypothetical protein
VRQETQKNSAASGSGALKQARQTGTLATSISGCWQILQLSGKKSEKRPCESFRIPVRSKTEGINAASPLLEKTHLRQIIIVQHWFRDPLRTGPMHAVRNPAYPWLRLLFRDMRRLSPIPAAVLALAMTGCAPTRIGRILDDPGHYRNRLVRVEGTVVASAGVLNTGAYQVKDDTGSIYVISRSGVPRTGTRVQVEGPVVGGAELMGQSLGTAIRERGHKVKY